MSLINQFERRFGHLAPENITYYLLAGQVLTFIYSYLVPEVALDLLKLNGQALLAGEFWRLITVFIYPMSTHPLWVVFVWMLIYLFGTALEKEWGTFRYLLYLISLYLIMIIVALIFPYLFFTNAPIYTSLFLAFAYLYPDYPLNLFFILPVKVKWLAWLAVIGIGITLFLDTLSGKIMAALPLANFVLFFHTDLWNSLRSADQGLKRQTYKAIDKQTKHMQCFVCKASEHDGKIFYYCDDCAPSTCFCEDHITDHKHRSKN